MNQSTFEETCNVFISENQQGGVELICWDCHLFFTSEIHLNAHLLYHIKQPTVQLKRVEEPLKVTAKTKKNTCRAAPVESSLKATDNTDSHLNTEVKQEVILDPDTNNTGPQNEEALAEDVDFRTKSAEADGLATISFSPDFADEVLINTNSSGSASPRGSDTTLSPKDGDNPEYGNIPGAEPTPPPEPSPEYPKIRIKTGLLKESLTITEITDDVNGDAVPGTNYSFTWLIARCD